MDVKNLIQLLLIIGQLHQQQMSQEVHTMLDLKDAWALLMLVLSKMVVFVPL